MVKDKRSEIQNIYDKFYEEFYSEKHRAIRDALKKISLKRKNESKFLHDLGKFVIFYSLPSVNPKIVVIGNNPSWFHPSNSTLAKENLDDVAEKIPTINSYKEHGHKFGDALINIFNENAELNENCPIEYQNLDRFKAREKIVNELEIIGALNKVNENIHTVPYGDRSGEVVEPWLTDQWFVNAKKLSLNAIDKVKTKATIFVPQNWEKTYFDWMENMQPWCISRQLI